MYLYFMIIIFTIMIASLIFMKQIDKISYINIIGCFLLVIITVNMGFFILKNEYLEYFNKLVYLDSFSLIQLFIITTVSLIASIYSHKYIKNDLIKEIITHRKAKIYYFLFTLFVFSMIFLSMCNNIMAMWIGLEATTLATAFLIGFNNNKLSLEAAWKYIIICSIGIGIGLVGIILFIYSIGAGSYNYPFQWTTFLQVHGEINKGIVKIAFTLIFVGVGTKAGLAPMHTWLSDGHSEAPSPISAMMSGILINLALYVIVRFYIIVRLISGIENLKYLFIVFGCISIVISTFSILKQTNYKRLLAFSSVENMGIITLGFGFGGTLGTFGAILHSIIHAYGKTLLFLVAGNILMAYKTKRIDRIPCLIKTMPKNSVALILGILVITGTPPFATFFSEIKILMAGINGGHYGAIGILIIGLLLAFVGFINIFIKMIFTYDNEQYKVMEQDNENLAPLIITFIMIIFISISFNNYLYPLLNKAVAIICG